MKMMETQKLVNSILPQVEMNKSCSIYKLLQKLQSSEAVISEGNRGTWKMALELCTVAALNGLL